MRLPPPPHTHTDPDSDIKLTLHAILGDLPFSSQQTVPHFRTWTYVSLGFLIRQILFSISILF